MKSKSSLIALTVLAAFAGWTTVEAWNLRSATQQVAASQQLEMRVAAKLDATRARQIHLANVDASARNTSAPAK